MLDVLPVPPADAPVWAAVASFAVLSPVFVILGYASMYHPAAFVVAEDPLLAEGEAEFRVRPEIQDRLDVVEILPPSCAASIRCRVV